MVTDLHSQLDLVRDYVNTFDLETGIDTISSPDELATWFSEQGLVDALPGLERYHLWHSTRAELLRRLGRDEEAAAAYTRALELAPSETERTFLRARLSTAMR